MMKFTLAFLITVTAIALNGCDNSTVASGPNAAQPPAASVPPPSIPAANAKTGDVLSVLTVEHQVDITAQHEGVVTAISKDEGSAVRANEVLGQLDDRALQTKQQNEQGSGEKQKEGAGADEANNAISDWA